MLRYHTSPISQPRTAKKRCYRKKYKRIRVTRNGGQPIIPAPTERFKHRPAHFFQNMTKSDLAVFNVLLGFRAKNWIVCPSQSTVGAQAGVCRDTVSVGFKRWEGLGLLSNNYRHNRTSLYNIAGIFWDKNFIRKYSKWLPALVMLLKIIPTQTSNISSPFKLISYFNKSLPVLSTYSNQRTTKRLNFPKKEENFGEHDMNCPPPVRPRQKSLAEITEIHNNVVRLSDQHKAWLSCFLPEALIISKKFLVNLLKKGKTVQNPFGFIYAQCMKQYRKERMKPDFRIYTALQEKLHFKESRPSKSSDIVYKPPTDTSAKNQHPYGFNHVLGIPYTREQYEEGQAMKRIRERRR